MADVNDDVKATDEYLRRARDEAFLSKYHEKENKFVEIKRLPKKIDARSLTSLIVSASRVIPKTTDICIRKDAYNSMEQVALVEFKSESEAFKAVDKIQSSAYGKFWQMRIVMDPKYSDPEADVMNHFVRNS